MDTDTFYAKLYIDALQQIEALHTRIFDLEAELFRAQLDKHSLEMQLILERAYSADVVSADRGARELINDIVEG